MNCIIGYVLVFLSIFCVSNGAPDGIFERLSDRIVGGTPANPGEFPYQASLRLNNRHICGAIIITNRAFLTAAHCLVNQNANEITVVVGSNLLDAGGDSYQASKLIVHPEYDRSTFFNDIGVIMSTEEIVGKDTVKSIPLSTVVTKEDETVVLSGFGYTSWPGQGVSNDLQKITLKTISDESCAEKLNRNIQNQICTLTRSGEGACFGDSGSPLVADEKLVGIVSFGVPCARGYPDAFTRVSSFVNWVTDIVTSN